MCSDWDSAAGANATCPASTDAPMNLRRSITSAPAAAFARWRHDSLQPQVNHHRPVHLVVVDQIRIEPADQRSAHESRPANLATVGLIQGVVGFVADSKRLRQFEHDVSL